jgi:N-acetylglucosaminyl-diphospho-decaprenol L-rhamnosyltransferase
MVALAKCVTNTMIMNHFDISVIIVNWKSCDYLRQCLKSIFEQNNSLTVEVIVVDNASYDGCREMLESNFPQVEFIQCIQNFGFASANNLAFRHSKGSSILFLNPDTEVQGAALEILLFALQSLPGAGMVGAKLLNSDFSLQTTCIAAQPAILNQILNLDILRKALPKWKPWGMGALFDKSLKPTQVGAISGACMLAKREALDQVDAFSTDYFMYAEDMDLCYKMAQAGWNIYYIPAATIVHHAGGSSVSQGSNFSNIVLRESLVQFFRKYRGNTYARVYRLSIVTASIVRIVVLMISSPLIILVKGYSYLTFALRKWNGILLWSVGFPGRAYRQVLTREPDR